MTTEVLARMFQQRSQEAKSTPELLKILGYKSRTRNFRSALSRLLDLGLIKMTLPKTSRSKFQKYIVNKKHK